MTSRVPVQDGWEPTRWWRAVAEDGRLWVESSNEAEVREHAARAPYPVTVQRLLERVERRWEDV